MSYQGFFPVHHSHGIDALSPSTDDIVYHKGPDTSISSPIGRSPVPLTPPHILGLFSPSQHTDAFLNSLIISPKRSKSKFDPKHHRNVTETLEFSDDEDTYPPASEHDEFLMGMGGMDDLEPMVTSKAQSDNVWYPSESFMSPPISNAQWRNPTPMMSSGEDSAFVSLSSMPVLAESPQTPPGSQFVEHPNGEHPSRTLFVRNINSNIEESELRELFEEFGPTRSIYTQCKHRGFVMVSFYDIRHAKNAIRSLQGKVVRRRKLDIHYSIPRNNPSEKDQNQGTLVVFNLDPSTSQGELLRIFGAFGEIKEIRETPNKKHHKFIEFYDVREAERAMKSLNKTDINGKKIKIEPSRPGGRKSASSRAIPSNSDASDSLLHQFPLSPSFDRNVAYSSSPPTSSRQYSPYHQQNSYFQGNNITSPTPIISSESHSPSGRRTRSRSSMNHSEYHHSNGKEQFSLDVNLLLSGHERRTTLMIRNIPNKYTQKMLLATLDEVIPGSYDFFYLPIDFKNKCNVGYAFINLTYPLSVVKLYQKLHMKKWERFNSEKVCEITFARIQGKEALVLHFQNSSLMSEDKKCRPVIFHTDGPQSGQQAPFPRVEHYWDSEQMPTHAYSYHMQ